MWWNVIFLVHPAYPERIVGIVYASFMNSMEIRPRKTGKSRIEK